MSAVGRLWRWAKNRLGPADRGSAVVEFLGVSLIMLVPLLYLVVTVSRIQSASFAAEGAAREAGRLIASADTLDEGLQAAQLGVELAFADQGFDVDPAQVLTVQCSVVDCSTAGEYVYIHIETTVDLPLIPDFLAGAIPAIATIDADAMTAVSGFNG